MNKELRRYCNEMFGSLTEELTGTWAVEDQALESCSASLKSIHKSYLGFATLCHAVSLEEDKNCYIASAPEACLLSIVMLVKGLENPFSVMMRQCIELTLKHVYFFTHPVEYKWSQERIDYKEVNFQFLLNYLRRSDDLESMESKEEMIKVLEEQFHILSRYVHVHNIQFASFSMIDYKSRVGQAQFLKLVARVNDVLSLLIVILVSFFHKKVLAAQANEQALIKSVVVEPYGLLLKKMLKDIS